MFDKLKENIRNLKSTALMVYLCQHQNVTQLIQNEKYGLIFKTTNWCWNNCAHCCESSGSRMPKTFIPESVIKGLIDQAITDEKFSREVVFTGGEITSAYKYAGQDYMPNIIKHALNAGCGVDIKTNAGFVNSKDLSNTIYSDIESIVCCADCADNDSGIKRIAKFNVSLSLDSFHRDALERDFKFIEHFANTNITNSAFSIRVSTIKQDKDMFPELLYKLKSSGIEVKSLYVLNPNTGNISEMLLSLNKNVILRYSCGTLFDGGRAKNIKYATKTLFPQFTFCSDSGTLLIAFDSFGNVTLGENSGKKISVPWCDTKTGQTLPLQTIRDNLVVATKSAEQEFLKEHEKMDAYLRWTTRYVK